MNLNERQLLRDPNIEPTGVVIAEGLGEAYETYGMFIRELGNYDITLMD